MGCYENKEMKRFRTGFFLMAAVVLAGGAAVILMERFFETARFVEAARTLYGVDRAEELLAFAGQRDYRSVWSFSILAGAAFAAYFFYMTGGLSKICGTIRRYSLCLEQMTAGKTVNLAEWKEGILAALSNQTELLYLRNQRMVELVQEEKETICQFTENMVHQMKTPLTAIRLDVDLMESKLSGGRMQEIGKGQEALLKKLEDCSFQCDRLQENVNEFLAASRLAAGQMKLLLKPARVEDIVEGACRTLAPVLERNNVHVNFSSESGLPLYCDFSWMREAIGNIMKNSAESMEGGGAIEIRHWDEEKWKYVELSDEGGGISEEAVRHIFERFYTGRQRSGGTGLGLNIAKEVVEACHGTIEAIPVSRWNGRKDGTCFLMKFRILEGPEAYEG